MASRGYLGQPWGRSSTVNLFLGEAFVFHLVVSHFLFSEAFGLSYRCKAILGYAFDIRLAVRHFKRRIVLSFVYR